MASKYGGVAVSKYGGVADGEETQPQPDANQSFRDKAIAMYRAGELNESQQTAFDELLSRGELSLTTPRTEGDYRSQLMQEMAAEVGPFEAAVIGAGGGLMNVARGVGLADDPTAEETAGFEALKEERPYTTGAGEIAGEALPFVPMGMGIGNIAKTGARVAASGLMGAAEGGIIAEGTGGHALTGAGIGGGIGVGAEMLFPVIGKMGRKVYQKVKGTMPSGPMLDATGKPTAELSDALQKAGISFEDLTDDATELISTQGGQFEPSQIARKEFLESQGVTPTKAQVTRDAADFQAQQEAAKSSGRVRQALDDQEAALTSRFDNAIVDTGGQASSPTVGVMDAVVDKATVLDSQISDLYKQAREAAPGAENVEFKNLTKLLRKYGPANRRTGGNVSAIMGDLKAAGVIDSKGKIVKNVDVETAEGIRKTMNSLYDPGNKYGNMILRELKDGLDDDVFTGAGDDVYKAARKSKADFEKGLSNAKISKFDNRKQNLVRDVLENKINPDSFVDDVIFSKKWRSGDIEQLKNYVGDGPAWNDLKADVLNTIKKRSFIGPEDADGFRTLGAARLENTVEKISPKLKAIFNPEEIKFIKDMVKVSKMRQPVRGTALGKGPSAQAVGALEAKLKNWPLLGNIVDFVNVDVAGRAALKGKPQKIAEKGTGDMLKRFPGIASAISIPIAEQEINK